MKKIIKVLIFMSITCLTMFLLSFSALAETNTSTVHGDTNGDGIVNIIDLVRLKKYLVSLTTDILPTAEVTGDDVVNAEDITLMRKYLLSYDNNTGKSNIEFMHSFNKNICSVCMIDSRNLTSIWDGTTATSFSLGDGSQENPYRINNANQLALLAQMCEEGNEEFSSKHYILETNIDLDFKSWTPIGVYYRQSNSKPIEYKYAFTGNFNGNGHTIIGSSNALFGYINSATIYSLGVVEANIEKRWTSVFVEDIVDSNIYNCFTSGKITAITYNSSYSSTASGFFKSASGYSTISNCYANVEVYAYSPSIAYAGGFGCSLGKGSVLKNCYSIGNISCISLNSNAFAGGLIGGTNSGSVNDCFSSGEIYIEGAWKEYGELCGYVYYTGNVNNSYSNCIIDALDNGNSSTICYSGTTNFDNKKPNFYYQTLGFSKNWDFHALTYNEDFFPKLIEFYSTDKYNHLLSETNGCIYLLNDDENSYSVTNCYETNEKVIIPSIYNNLPVNRISSCAFSNNTSISEIQIGNNINTIESKAFNNCSQLETIIFTNSNVVIENNTFSMCPIANVLFDGNDTGIYFSNGILYNESITDIIYVFDTAKEVIIPNTVVSLGNKFQENKNIISVTFENNSQLSKIEKEAFYNCTNLKTIEIPENITNIGEHAFLYCENLETIKYNAVCASVLINNGSAGVVFYGAGQSGIGISVIIGKKVKEIPMYLFASYYSYTTPKIVDVKFEEGSACEKIGNSAFEGCSYLQTIEIPNSINQINSYAFNNCKSLTNVYFEDTTNWFVSSSYTATSGTNVSLTDSKNNALYLNKTYSKHYWFHN